jgi:hypothetical protein
MGMIIFLFWRIPHKDEGSDERSQGNIHTNDTVFLGEKTDQKEELKSSEEPKSGGDFNG